MDSGTTGSGARTGLSGKVLLASWALTIVLFYWGAGGWLALAVEGNDRSLFPAWPGLLSLFSLLVSIVVTVLWARGLLAERAAVAPVTGLGRRRFLAGAGTMVGGIVASFAALLGRNAGWITVTGGNIVVETPTGADAPRSEWAGSRVTEYRRLGRTGFEVSDISLGSSRILDEEGERVARLAIERGVNYFDTAPDYSEEGSELALGKAMKGHREKMFLATKFCTPQGNLPAGSSVASYMTVVEESLRRLQTDYVDLVHIHSCDTLERLLDPNVHEAFGRLKEQGKVRFLGFSSHTPNLELISNTAIDDGRFDVMMLAYHHGAWSNLQQIVDRAHAADIGVVAMKTLKGAKHKGLLETRAEQDSYTQAAFKWVLNDPSIACLVISFRELANVDEYLYASGKRPGSADYAILENYDRLIAGKHCYQHCGACLSACPEGLPIDDVLRHRMYFRDYGHEREAMRLYGKLETKADVCTGCDAPCVNACPFGVPIAEYTQDAHQLLTLS